MKNAATVFMALIFVIGLVITIFSFKIAGTLVDCSTSSQNALRGLIVMGTALICIPITILAFNCQLKSTEKESMMGNVFVVLLLLINIAITGLASVIHNECEDSRTYTSILITLSVFGIISCFSYLGYEGYKKFGKGKDKGEGHEMRNPAPNPNENSPGSSYNSSPSSPSSSESYSALMGG
jgi:hypothetical protein